MTSFKFLIVIGISFLITVWFCPMALAVAPVVSDVTVTDVTPVSFSVVWKSDIPGTSDLNVFTDADGTTPAAGITIESQPVENGDAAIAAAAEDIGVMKVRVTGLAADTVYYYQTVTTEKGGSDTTLFPNGAPFSEVTTAAEVVRTRMQDSAEVPQTNDLLVYDCDVPGALLVAEVAGSDYPVSGFVGDGVDATFAYVDLNNVFSFGITLALRGNEYVELTKFKGIQGIESSDHWLPDNSGAARIQLPLDAPLCRADIAAPKGTVDVADLIAFLIDFGKDNCSGDDCPGDLDADFDVDGDDHWIMIEEYGRDDCP